MLKSFASAFRQLFRPLTDRRTAAQGVETLERKVLHLVENMPAMPAAATRAMALADDPDVRLTELADLIRQDPAIASGLLRVANSAAFACGSSVTKLDQAVSRLGSGQVKRLILSIAVKSQLAGVAGPSRASCDTLWRHGSVTAAIAQQLNREFRLGFRGEEYTAGLLHDLGRVLVAMADPVLFAKADSLNFREGPETLVAERDAYAFDHADLGGLFAEHSRFPADLTAAIRHHHDSAFGGPHARLVALVAAADQLANYAHGGGDPAAYDVTGNAGLVALGQEWPESRRERLVAALPGLLTPAADGESDQ